MKKFEYLTEEEIGKRWNESLENRFKSWEIQDKKHEFCGLLGDSVFLNELGKEGWDFQVHPFSTSYGFFCKREIEADRPVRREIEMER